MYLSLIHIYAVLGALTDALVGDLLAVQQHLAAVELFQTGQTIDKLGDVYKRQPPHGRPECGTGS